MAERFRARLPAARVELVGAANHLVFIDQTERVYELLTEFLGPGQDLESQDSERQ
jgi:hypothetical protein